MKKLIFALLIGLLATSCGKKLNAVVDPELAPYLEQFQNEVGVTTGQVSAGFGHLTMPVIGQCSYDSDTNQITIDPNFWSTMLSSGKEQLMYHELGHCALFLGHTSDYVTSAEQVPIPGSIMNPYWFGDDWFYPEYRAGYVQALRLNTLLNAGSDQVVTKAMKQVITETASGLEL